MDMVSIEIKEDTVVLLDSIIQEENVFYKDPDLKWDRASFIEHLLINYVEDLKDN